MSIISRFKKIPKGPINKGVAKTPVIMQMETQECGAASLSMIFAYYGRWETLEKMRLELGVSRDGSNARNILKTARNYGFNAKAFRYEPDALREKGMFPCIIHWNFNHFLVLNGFRGNKAYLNDPAKGTYAVSLEEFDRAFTGVCMFFEPNEDFKPEGKPKSMLSFARERLRGAEAALLFIVLTSLITALLGVIKPVFSRIFIDRLLTGKNPEWLIPFIWALSGFIALEILMTALKTVYGYKINGKFSAVGNATYFWHVLHLPMEFFSQRMAGDIQSRQKGNASIAHTLVNIFAPLALNAIMMVFYLVAMIRYNTWLTLLGLVSVFVNLFMSRIISKKRVNISRVQMRDQGKLASATINCVEAIETIKASGAENGYFEKWAGYQAELNTQSVKYVKVNQYLSMIPSLVSSITNLAVTIVGVYMIIEGYFTVGMLMAFQGFLNSFTGPVNSLISAGQSLQEMRSAMERIDDVMKYPKDEKFSESTDGKEIIGKLSGKIEMRGVTFGYSRLAEPLIQDFNLTLEPGKRVALVGASGCGKSTLAKLIAGLYTPWEGEILFDGKKHNEIDRSIFKASVAVVDQEIALFADSVSDNIRMWDDSIEDFVMTVSAHEAQIHYDIMKLEGGYDCKLLEKGKNFSGGQRQRLEIARALAQEPSILIMDEATSALDAKTENDVVSAIERRGITSIIIAHRLSTVRDADEIIVLDRGRVVERGTHDQLIQLDGAYKRLVTSD